MKKFYSYLCTAIMQISAPELLMISLNITAYVLCGTFVKHFYLWCIVAVCDILIIGAHGAWLEAGKDNVDGPWRTPTPIIARCVATAFLFILAIENSSDKLLSMFSWYVIVIAAVCHAFFSVLIAMHANNDTWLEGTNGKIGTPNWISITRMALSVLIPHIYAVQPFGAVSNWIATVTLISAIVTDAVDGYIARKMHQTTKAGKALDPLGDKVIFYFTAVGIVFAMNGVTFLETDLAKILFYACLIVMLVRDALFITFFFKFYTKLKDGIGASMVDKVRMATMCVWLAASALALTLPAMQTRLTKAALVCIVIVAILSVASVFVDYDRVKDAIKKKPANAE